MAQATTIEPRSLPSLKEVVISKPKKKMGTNITLSEFNNCSFDYGLMRDETFTLLTSPKERFA
ncbi:hypothetical protein GYH30_048014 [Glycine max]|nr:hypothetical protein GYH30_048014 [Glycine max]